MFATSELECILKTILEKGPFQFDRSKTIARVNTMLKFNMRFHNQLVGNRKIHQQIEVMIVKRAIFITLAVAGLFILQIKITIYPERIKGHRFTGRWEQNPGYENKDCQ